MDENIVIVLDIDGTITPHKKTSREIIEKVKDMGVPVVFNTSRLKIWKQMGLRTFNIPSKDIYHRIHINETKSKIRNLYRICYDYNVKPMNVYMFDNSCKRLKKMRRLGFNVVCVDSKTGVNPDDVYDIFTSRRV